MDSGFREGGKLSSMIESGIVTVNSMEFQIQEFHLVV
jgi:hypothetical protein